MRLLLFLPRQLQFHHFSAQDNPIVKLWHQRVIRIPSVRVWAYSWDRVVTLPQSVQRGLTHPSCLKAEPFWCNMVPKTDSSVWKLLKLVGRELRSFSLWVYCPTQPSETHSTFLLKPKVKLPFFKNSCLTRMYHCLGRLKFLNMFLKKLGRPVKCKIQNNSQHI